MQYQSLYNYYWFGTCMRFLQDVQDSALVHGDGYLIWNFDQMFENLDTLNLRVTKRLAHKKLDSYLSVIRAKPEDGKLSPSEVLQLRTIMYQIRDTVDAEIKGVGAYTPTAKRLDLQRLMDDVSGLFSPEVFKSLPEIARFDFAEAGKCIAFERPTAAAFHILRGTEDVLRHYYFCMVRHSRIKSLMWGPIVTDLKKRTLTKKYEALNNHLDNIRVSFRNPTQHPEAIYDIHEVQDLWAVCIDVINRMSKTLRDENRLSEP